MTQVKVPETGKTVTLLTPDEIKELVSDTTAPRRKECMTLLQDLGKHVTEAVRMKNDERVAWLTERMAELGGAGAPAAAKKTTAAAAKTATKTAVKKAAPAPEPEPEPEAEEEAGDGASSAAIEELKELITAQGAQLERIQQQFAEVVSVLLDVHLMTRAQLLGVSLDDVPALKDEYYGQLVVSPPEEEAEGND